MGSEESKGTADPLNELSRQGSPSKLHRDEGISADQLQLFLHGVIYVTVHSARDLPFASTPTDASTNRYVVVSLDDRFRLAKTSKAKTDVGTRWEERFHADVASVTHSVHIAVMDNETAARDRVLGQCRVPAGLLLSEEHLNGWRDLYDDDGRPNGAAIDVDILYISAETLKKRPALPDSYYPVRPACHVRLYQDAHTPHNPLFQEIQLLSGERYQPTCAFKDIVQAIKGARDFVYLTGWSVSPETRLVRESDEDEITLGELLKQKAEEGVRVLGMIWDEKSCLSVTPGLMGTRGEETAKYFADTTVKMVFVPRTHQGALDEKPVTTCYTHHQKSIVVDAEGSGLDGKRRIVAFVGGLDLTQGRWDTPVHDLFNSLTTYHRDDFHNISARVRPEVGPRHPWHDVQSRVCGLAAYDVMQNFLERWHKQVSEDLDLPIDFSQDEYQYSVDDIGEVPEEDRWSVQVFRSISKESATFPGLRSQLCLTGKKRCAYDDSIHRAYIHHIRRAEHFLYFETEVFQGGCGQWNKPETNCCNLVPIEVTSKIIEKIRARERFAVYIVIPMYPEGDPESDVIQEMLHWQQATMQMMYTKLALELKRLGLSDRATDYLNFYFLGNREGFVPEELTEPSASMPEVNLRWSKRFQIYVHSKTMIADDEFILIGSANINQRSLSGDRDTEIAIGAWQNQHTREATDGAPPGGAVRAFRLALWIEHLAAVDDVFFDPASLKCVRRVNSLAAKNWALFTSKTATDMRGHLMPYPVQVLSDGTVAKLPRWKTFLDTDAPVLGGKSSCLSHKLTT